MGKGKALATITFYACERAAWEPPLPENCDLLSLQLNQNLPGRR